jgi:hypothetical protein
MSEGRFPKRERKPKTVYAPEQPEPKKRRVVTKKSKNRNEAADGTQENKWKLYRDRIKKALAFLTKEIHNMEVNFEGKTAPSRGSEQWEKMRRECEEKIFKAKQLIVSTLRAIASENSEHKRWPQLAEADENDMISVDEIYCSKCNLEETEDNDILFCDREGCLRAYHQKCLDPPLNVTNIDPVQDWFCWQCECLDDCLDVISERMEAEYWKWEDVFPEVNQSLEDALKNGNIDTINSVLLPDDEEDEDYDPSEGEEVEAERGGEDEGDEENEAAEEDVEAGKVKNDYFMDDFETSKQIFQDKIEEQEGEEGSQEEEDDNEEGEEDDEDDENDFADYDEDDEDDGIDEDELKDLLTDAQNDIIYEAVSSNTRKLRERKPQKNTLIISLEGEKDIGRPIAKIRRGVFQIGKIIGYERASSEENNNKDDEEESLSGGQWTVRFGDKAAESTTSEDNNTSNANSNENSSEHNYFHETGSNNDNNNQPSKNSEEFVFNENETRFFPLFFVVFSLFLTFSPYLEKH